MVGVHANFLKTISTISIPLPVLGTEQVSKVDAWLRSILWESELPNDNDEHQEPFEIHRLKGRLLVQNGGTKIIQGVRELFEIFDAPTGGHEGWSESGKIVLIGRHVTDFNFKKSLLAAIV